MQWYTSQCDGDWEHSFGIKIGTLDNPGWSLTINLSGTSLENAPFEDVAFGSMATDAPPLASWHTCRVRGRNFEGYGGPFDLETIISTFRQWAEFQSGLSPAE